jgi:ubiquinone/menaquinone biosynthesis C-methylase UbiE
MARNVETQGKLVDQRFQSTALYWQQVYETRDLDALIYQQRQAAALRLVEGLGLPSEAHILEVGCGAGFTATALAERGYRVKAVDRVPAMVDLTSQRATRAGVAEGIDASLGDVRHLAFPDGAFSVVLAIGVTPWLESLDDPLREMARVLKPGGHLVVSADNRWCLAHVLDPWLDPLLAPVTANLRRNLRRLRQRPGRAVQASRHSIKGFDTSLSAAGLEKIAGLTLGFGPFSFLGRRLLPDHFGISVHQALQSLADRGCPVVRSTGAHYLLLARKPPPSRVESY